MATLNTMMCNYLRHFVPEDTIIDVIEGGMLYIIVKDALEPSS